MSRLALGAANGQVSEDELQALIHSFAECLPIGEIDSLYLGAVPVCRELSTPAGPIDNLLITPTGLPVLVECKLWRNPQARREVVGQIIDYAKELTRWTPSDLQREVGRRVQHNGNPLKELLNAAGHDVNEARFNDSLAKNLRTGRFLLLIVGDGIRESVEAIADYLQQHTGLQFTLGLVEMSIFELEEGRRIVVPRVMLKTELVKRSVIELPQGLVLAGDEFAQAEPSDDDRQILNAELADPTSRIRFWQDFEAGLKFDDPEIRHPKPGRNGWISLVPPFKLKSAWMVLYRTENKNEVGVNVRFEADDSDRRLVDGLLERWPDTLDELGGTASLSEMPNGRTMIGDAFQTGSWKIEAERQKAFDWLRARANHFANVLFPKLKLLMEELEP